METGVEMLGTIFEAIEHKLTAFSRDVNAHNLQMQ